ncbi:uncharacterized protein LOC143066268 [Mytilus galloprovincialis]|uniref:uncharacterized protein LOC143066268 n=1 Tax=Mytilus galloprovincialis TaxID=29158 RepID=UPI003F7BAEBA
MIKENHKKDHRKADTIYEALRTTVFPVVRETIKILFKTEVKCQQCASAIDLPKTTTTRRPIPATYPNSRWQVDLKKMPAVRGYTYACNIIDCYSRFAFGGPTKTKTAKEIADLILKYLYLLGSPRILQSDNGKEISNSNLADVIDVFKTRQIHGRPYHPQSQGRVERFNRTLTEYFRIQMSVHKDWPSELQEFYYNYNNRVHKASNALSRLFLTTAHLDVEDKDLEPHGTEESTETYQPEVGDGFISEHINDGVYPSEENISFEEAMDRLEMDTNVEETSRGQINSTNNNNITENVNKEAEISKQSNPVEENADERICDDEAVDCDPLASASHYYRALYERQFGTDLTNEINPNYNPCTSQNQFVNEGLMEYLKEKQLELYPLELFGGDSENVFTPAVGEVLQFRTNPAMNKGTAVFVSGYWRKGKCINIINNMSRGKLFVIEDDNTKYKFELNRYQLRPYNC